MQEHMMQGAAPPLVAMWAFFFVLAVTAIAAIAYFARRAPNHRLLVADLAAGQPSLFWKNAGSRAQAGDAIEAHDTIFILPDISNYTRFMTGNRFAFGHAQHVVFSLINAMIEAACKTVELSKLEGDAALFFVDAKRLSSDAVGQTVLAIFAAFFRERARLVKANVCPCSACNQIQDLDLKIFVHRGRASRFEFRGAIDHFGTDVIILHRMMKNGVRGHRYVMVTEAAGSCITMPGDFQSFEVSEDHEHIGKVSAKVFEISDAMAEAFSAAGEAHPSRMYDLGRKLRQNLASIRGAFRKR